MFGALAGKLLVEGRRPILLNQCVPMNHRISCQGGKGDCWSGKCIENFKKKEFTSNIPNILCSQSPQLSNVLWLFWASYSFLKSGIKVKFTYLKSAVNMPRGRDISSQNLGQQEFFSYVMEKKEIWWIWKNWDCSLIGLQMSGPQLCHPSHSRN